MDPISERHRPHYVRISFPKYAGDIPEIGHSIKTTAYVTPPQDPLSQMGLIFANMPISKVWAALDMRERGLSELMPLMNSGIGRIGKGAFQIVLLSICQSVHLALHSRLFRVIA